jgi:hypothetical protein
MGSCDQGGGNPIGLDVGIHVIAKPFNVLERRSEKMMEA